MSLTEFLAMGGYGAYVWSAYGITVAVLAWQLILPVVQRRQIVRQIRRRKRQEARRA
ncbi:heme exporter protein CcmD [Ectothiorhodospiraceae bacterium WFHF3C12]|nr:heme exporter protein CcmD [Ectothiorhodospiraceae bacterium WFHF3C12]